MFRRLDISYIFTWIIFTSYYVNTAVPDPCPVIEPSLKVSDMCKASNAVEDLDAGNDNIDSVVLRVMIQEDGCVCNVTVDNPSVSTVYIKKYDSSVSPEHYPCGLAIDISNNHTADSPNPIECRNGHDLRTVAFSKTGAITLTSRVIGGNFNTGYCIQISKKDNSGVHIGIGVGVGIFAIITIVIIIVILYKRHQPYPSTSNVNNNVIVHYNDLSIISLRDGSNYSTLNSGDQEYEFVTSN